MRGGWWWTYQISEHSSLALEIFEIQGLLRSEYLVNQLCNKMSLLLRLNRDALILLGHMRWSTTKTRTKLE